MKFSFFLLYFSNICFVLSLSMGLSIYWKLKLEKMNENNMECLNKANKILIDMPLTVKTQPPYDTAVINVQNNAQISSNIYSSLILVLVHNPFPFPLLS